MELFGKFCHDAHLYPCSEVMLMTTMNISLPEPLKNFVDSQVQDGGYSTSSEYVRDLIRRDQVRRAEQQLAALIMEGLESGSAIPADDHYWKNKRTALKQRHKAQ
jgi:antitoxin ParD1/3/4